MPITTGGSRNPAPPRTPSVYGNRAEKCGGVRGAIQTQIQTHFWGASGSDSFPSRDGTLARRSIEAVALTAKQRSKLPPSAFLDPKARRFPVPTQTQAKRAGISEAQRVRTLRSALSRAGQTQAKGVRTVTPTAARRKVATRSASKVASVKRSR